MIFVFAVVFAALVFAWIPPVVWLGVAIYGAGSVLVIMGLGACGALLKLSWTAMDTRLQANGVPYIYRAIGAVVYAALTTLSVILLAVVFG